MAIVDAIIFTGSGGSSAVIGTRPDSGDGTVTVDNSTCDSCRTAFAWSGRVGAENVSLYIAGYDGIDYTSKVDAYDSAAAVSFTADLEDGMYTYMLINSDTGDLIDIGDFAHKCSLVKERQCLLEKAADKELQGSCLEEFNRLTAVIMMADSLANRRKYFEKADLLLRTYGCDC